MELPRKYAYNPKWWAILASAAFFGACAAFMGYKAAHNSAGVIINGLVTLGPAGATVFYWIVAATAGLFVLAAIAITLRRILSPKVLELTTDSLLLPYGFLQKKTSRIAYADIQRVEEIQISGQTFLYVTAGGLRFTITASLLPDKDSYTAISNFLRSQVNADNASSRAAA